MYLSKDLDISTSINRGKILEESIIENSNTLIYSTNYDYDQFDLENTWMDYTSLKVVYHDGFGLGLNHPTNIGELVTLSVFEIDLKLLMIQYKYWSLDRLKNDLSTDPSIFVYTFILTNLIPYYLDISIMNRFFNYETKPVIKTTNTFSIRENTFKVNKELKSLNKRLMKKRMYYEEFLKSIPLVKYDTLYDMLRTPYNTINTNNRWCYFISKSEVLIDIIEFLGNKGIKGNAKHINQLFMFMKRLKSSNTIMSMDLKDNELLIEYNYDRLLEIVNDRSL
jgi:hypothetical protein